jgi:esterase/lipase superfamily enzyme
MQKETWTWTSARFPEAARLVRWGHFGTPVLLFPSAGGDPEEVERFGLVGALEWMVSAGRIKVYSVDGLSMQQFLRATLAPEECAHRQTLYDAFVYEEVVPRVRGDCKNDALELITAGIAFGAFQALAALTLHPDAFRAAIGESGVYDLTPWLRGARSGDYSRCAPLSVLPGLTEGPRLALLRQRRVILETGEGQLELPDQSREMAAVLESKGIPCSLRLRGPGHDHEWQSWRELLPAALSEVT